MIALTAADCLAEHVERVQEEDRPSLPRKHNNHEALFAVFYGSATDGEFRGLATERDISLHPGWIFADLTEHRPLVSISPETEVRQVLDIMERQACDALAVLDGAGRFLGAVTRTTLLLALLREAERLYLETDQDRARLAEWSTRLTKLHEASRKLLGVMAMISLEKDLLRAGIEALADLLQARYGAIGLLDEEGGLREFIFTGISAEAAERIGHFPEGKGLLGVVVRENQALRMENLALDARSAGFPPGHPPMKSLLAVPVSRPDKVYGRVYLCDKIDDTPFSVEDELLAMSFSHTLALVMDNLREMEATRRAHRELDYLAHFDTLTGLPNRVLLSDRIRQSLAQAARHGCRVALLLIDLDNFKHINDSLGHSAGDCLLKRVARKLSACLRTVDTVARLGGDEFIVVLPDLAEATDAARVAQNLLEIIRVPCLYETQQIYISSTIGISMYPEDGGDLDRLLTNADIAMYHAKAMGKNAYQFYAADMNIHAHNYLKLVGRLRHALKREEFVLYYQPQVELATGRTHAVEALLRWNNAELGLVSPADFIPLAEETGLIASIGEWVLRTACKQANEWSAAGLEIRVCVNLSVNQLQPPLASVVASALADSGLPPALLELEVTESALMRDIEGAMATMRTIRQLGVRFAIDDFGTGYSSLNYLKRMPLDVLKIDKSFVNDIADDSNDAAIVAAITEMARQLGLDVVAEGVETEAQLEFLRQRACRHGQGYLFSHPLPSGQVTRLLAGTVHFRGIVADCADSRS